MEDKLLLGIDIGTYSTKGVLVNLAGEVQKSFIIEHLMDIPQPGWAEQDADNVWWADVIKVCKNLLDGSPYSGENVAALAVSAIGPCMLPLDKYDRPLRKGILYGVDTRASEEIDQLNRKIGEEEIFKFSGMALSSQAVGPKILWLRNHEPDLWKKTKHITTASSYIILKLTGEKVMDRHTASHYMPLIDIQTLDWSTKYTDDIIDISLLPRVAWSDEIAGSVSKRVSIETGLKQGTPVAVGAVDALSEAISVGAVQPGDLMVMYGSTAFFILVLPKPTPDPRMWTVAGAFSGQFNLAAGMATTGSLTRWFKDQLARELPAEQAYSILYSEAESVPAGSNGLLILPYFSGERTPINDPYARGIIAGLTLSHERKHIYRAILEGIAYGIRHNIDTFKSIGGDIKRIIAVGGGTKSKAWMQIVSDVCGMNQILPELTIGASYGDAFLAGLATGNLNKSDITNWVKPGKKLIPDISAHDHYSSLYYKYLELYQKTRGIIHQLGDGH